MVEFTIPPDDMVVRENGRSMAQYRDSTQDLIWTGVSILTAS